MVQRLQKANIEETYFIFLCKNCLIVFVCMCVGAVCHFQRGENRGQLRSKPLLSVHLVGRWTKRGLSGLAAN